MRDLLEPRLRRLLRPRPDEETALRTALEEALEGLPAADDLLLRPGVDPVLLGRLVTALLARTDVSDETKTRACEALFDAIPLPEREDEAFLTPATVPPGLPEAARFLARRGDFGDYHLLHLTYALYLDPGRAAAAPPAVLEDVLGALLAHEASEDLKLLCGGLLLAAPSARPAAPRALFDALLASGSLSEGGKAGLCRAVLDPAAARSWFAERARREGLVPAEDRPEEDLLREVRFPRFPDDLRPPARAWLRARDH